MNPAPAHSWGETYHAAAAMIADGGVHAHVASAARRAQLTEHAQAYVDKSARLFAAQAQRSAWAGIHGGRRKVTELTSEIARLTRDLENEVELCSFVRMQAIVEFFEQCGLGDRLDHGPKPENATKGRLEVGKASHLVWRAYAANRKGYEATLRDRFLRGTLTAPTRRWVDDTLRGTDRILLLWVREPETLARDRERFMVIARTATARGRTPVLFGRMPGAAERRAFEALGARELLRHWEPVPSYGEQLQLFEYLRTRYDATQIGHKSGGLDGPMFLGMRTTQIVPQLGEVFVDRDVRWNVDGGDVVVATPRVRVGLRALAWLPARVCAHFDLVRAWSMFLIRNDVWWATPPRTAHLRHIRMFRLAHYVPTFSVVDDSEIDAGDHGAGLPLR